MPEPAELITAALAGGLTHPGDDKSGPIALQLPMFRASAIPPEMAAEFAEQAGLPSPDLAKLTGEAIVHLLSENGLEVVGRDELAKMRVDASATESHRHKQVRFRCTCGEPLFAANVSDYGTDHPSINGQNLVKAMQQLSPDCGSKHRVAT